MDKLVAKFMSFYHFARVKLNNIFNRDKSECRNLKNKTSIPVKKIIFYTYLIICPIKTCKLGNLKKELNPVKD